MASSISTGSSRSSTGHTHAASRSSSARRRTRPAVARPPLPGDRRGTRRTGERIGWGARQEVDFTHAAFRFHAERVIRAIVGRYAAHPAVIGFQVDNEPGLVLFHNHGVFQRFVDSLRRRYGYVETLNERWGLVYWSHRLSTWADLWRPDGNAQPQYDLAWRRFQADETTAFIEWQADIVRRVRTARPVRHDVSGVRSAGRRRRGPGSSSRCHRRQPLLRHAGRAHAPGPRGERSPGWKIQGVWALFKAADRMYASRQAPFLVTETNASNIGEPWDNRPAFDGQWRQAAWAFIARGARMIEYWHWNTLRYGAETYWGGVLPHSDRPGRTYRELAALGAEIEAAGSLVAGARPGRRRDHAAVASEQVAHAGAPTPRHAHVGAGSRTRTTDCSTPSTAERSMPGAKSGSCMSIS